MNCPACSSNNVVDTTRDFVYRDRNKDIVVVTDVPILHCKDCGRDTLDWEVRKTIDSIVDNSHVTTVPITVSAARFPRLPKVARRNQHKKK